MEAKINIKIGLDKIKKAIADSLVKKYGAVWGITVDDVQFKYEDGKLTGASVVIVNKE